MNAQQVGNPQEASADRWRALCAPLRSMPRELLLSGAFGGGPAGAVPLLVSVEQELFRRLTEGEPESPADETPAQGA